MERGNANLKEVLKTRFYFNYFTCYSGTNTQDSQDGSILNDCTCITYKLLVALYQVIASPGLSDTTFFGCWVYQLTISETNN